MDIKKAIKEIERAEKDLYTTHSETREMVLKDINSLLTDNRITRLDFSALSNGKDNDAIRELTFERDGKKARATSFICGANDIPLIGYKTGSSSDVMHVSLLPTENVTRIAMCVLTHIADGSHKITSANWRGTLVSCGDTATETENDIRMLEGLASDILDFKKRTLDAATTVASRLLDRLDCDRLEFGTLTDLNAREEKTYKENLANSAVMSIRDYENGRPFRTTPEALYRKGKSILLHSCRQSSHPKAYRPSPKKRLRREEPSQPSSSSGPGTAPSAANG